MDFTKVIYERSSCKKFDETKKIEEEKLQNILNAGRIAPTAKNLQEYHIYVIQNKDILKKIDEITPCRYHANTILVVTYDTKNVFVYPGGKKDSGIEDASIVATHLMLASKNEGLESCWINFFDPDKFKKILPLKAEEEVLMMLDLGYGAEDAILNPNHQKRKSLNEVITRL